MSLDFDTLRDSNVRRQEESWPEERLYSLADWSNAMQGEAGEAGNVVKKIRRIEVGVPRSRTTRDEYIVKLGAELADIVCYADLLAHQVGLNLGEEVRKKFNEVSRKYGSSVFL